MDVLLTGRWASAAEHQAWQQALAAALAQALPGARLLAEPAATVEAAVVANPAPGALAGLPRLRGVQSLWAGVERLLADATLPAHLPLARMVDPAMSAAMAETALWAVLSLHRGFYAYQRQQAAGQWQPLPQRRADEVGVLVLGQGALGGAAAQRLGAVGYRVHTWARQSGPAALPGLLAQAEVLVNLLPLTPATRGLLDAHCFAALPRGAAVVNLARGAHLVAADLLAALASGQLSHAVLDVFDTEPLPAGHPFWAHPQVTVLPHAAAQTDPRSAAAVAADNLARLARGQAMQHLVDRDRGY